MPATLHRPMPAPCATADQLERDTHCLRTVSKDVRGELRLLDRERRRCPDSDCRTLVTDHVLRAEVATHDPCDEVPELDGRLFVRRLVTTFREVDGTSRGVHAGDFAWNTGDIVVRGDLRGMTNVGTHREPAFEGCQECHMPGDMEGMLCGRVIKATDDSLVGTQVTGAYRLRFDASEGAQDTDLRGTFEGVTLRACRDDTTGERTCVELGTLPVASHPNPWTVQDVGFEVRTWTDALAGSADVVNWGSHTGLNANYHTVVTLPEPASQVDITLVHFVTQATVEAVNAAGVVVATATMTVGQDTPETLSLSGPGITQLHVRPPQDETLITRLCWVA